MSDNLTSVMVRFYNKGSALLFEHYDISYEDTAERVAKQLAALFSEVYLVYLDGDKPVATSRVYP